MRPLTLPLSLLPSALSISPTLAQTLTSLQKCQVISLALSRVLRPLSLNLSLSRTPYLPPPKPLTPPKPPLLLPLSLILPLTSGRKRPLRSGKKKRKEKEKRSLPKERK